MTDSRPETTCSHRLECSAEVLLLAVKGDVSPVNLADQDRIWASWGRMITFV
jgi:hypothetical protein